MLQRRRASFSFEAAGLSIIKNKVLEWMTHSGTFLYLDSHGYEDHYGRYEMLAACQPLHRMNDMSGLRQAPVNEWIFGHVGYDFKNELFRGLKSAPAQAAPLFSDLQFFVPQTVCYILRGQAELIIESTEDAASIIEVIMAGEVRATQPLPKLQFQRSQQESDYYKAIAQVQAHIAAGDCYELNYCSRAFAQASALQPLPVYQALKEKAPAPFSAFYRDGNAYMMGASPERFFCKRGDCLTAQPIKGTAGRGADAQADALLKEQLRQSKKDQAENVMIVDLMRNDLARLCRPGSIQVAELFGIYSFPTVHQMISTVCGRQEPGTTLADILELIFPMGSMTGAPKKRVLEIIAELECGSRGLYAGTVGYQSPDGDADFNVVIRSLFYNKLSGTLSYQSGGAITHQSIPQQEWEELLLKGRALEQLFAGREG